MPHDSPVLHEEVFGPLLPVVPYDSPDEAIAVVNTRRRALALYWFGRDQTRLRTVLERTWSGGLVVNDTVVQAAVEALPFGGVGGSGFGAYHGRTGFQTFTHQPAVLLQSGWSGTRFARPPYGPVSDRLIQMLIR